MFLGFFSTQSNAATSTWDGAGSNSAWATGGNWADDILPADGNDIIFDAASANSKWSIDIGATREVESITFAAEIGTAQGFTLHNSNSSRRLDVGSGGIVNNDDDTQTFQTITVRGTAGQTWNAAAGDLSFAKIEMQGHSLTIAGDNDVSVSNTAATMGSLTKNGTGSLSFANTTSLSTDAIWTVNSGSLTINATLDLNDNDWTLDNDAAVTINGSLATSASAITKSGSGTLTLAGTSHNNYTGGITITEGLVLLNKTAGQDAFNNGSAAIDVTITGSEVRLLNNNQIDNSAGIAIGAGGVLNLQSFSEQIGPLEISDGGQIQGTGTLTIGGTSVTANSGSSSIDTSVAFTSGTKTFTVGTGAALEFNGDITSIRTIVKEGAGTLTFDGDLTISGGNATWSLNEGHIDVNGDLNMGSNSMTFNGDSTAQFDGAISGADNIILHASFSGGIVFSGTNTFTGSLTLNGGSLEISADHNLGNTANNLSFSGGTLNVTEDIDPGSGRTFSFGSNGGTLNVASSKTLTLTDGGQIAGSGDITKTGGGTLDLQGANNSSYNNNIIHLNGGVIKVSAENNLGGTANDLTFDGGTLNVTSGFTANSGKVFAMNSGGGTLDIDSSQTLTLGTDGQLSGSGNLTKSGSGTLALSGNNSSSFNSGNTISINGGTVEISNENNLGGGGNDLAFNGGTLKVSSGFTANSGKTLTFNGSGGTLDVTSGTLSFNSGNQLYGSGDLTKSGAGDLVISADNPSYSGNLKLNSGELQVAGTGAQLSSFLNNTRMANLSGTGPATFMVNQTDSGTATLGTGPVLPSQIKLGFEGSGTFALGTTANDMSNFEGLIIEGGTVSVRANQRFTGDAAGGGTSAGTSLYISGGELELFHADSKTLEFTGNITLAGGVIDGGLSGGAKGKLRTESDLIVNSVTTLQSKPDLEFLDNAADAHTISLNGASSTGWGTITLAGQNQLTVNATGGAEVGANRIDVSTGTLLWGADNVITGTTEIKLGYGGTVKTMGYDDTVGPLTLDSTIGYIDLDGGDSTLEFADTGGQLWSGGGQLVIKNWDGQIDGNGNDKVIFGDFAYTGDGLTDEQLAQIWFENPAGFPPGMYPAEFVPNQSGYSHFGQIRPKPVPEPATVAMVVLLIGVAAYRERRHIAQLKALWIKLRS